MGSSRLFYLIISIALILCVCGCGGEKYAVDYGDNRELFENASDTYKEGEKVTLRIRPAEDKTYFVYIDGTAAISSPDSSGKYVNYRFTMPPHDIVVSVQTVGADTEPLPETIDVIAAITPDYYITYSERAEGEERDSYSFTLKDAEDVLLLEVIRNAAGEGRTQGTYAVPREMIAEVQDIIARYGMKEWSGTAESGSGSGYYRSCSFYDTETGAYITVDTGMMPSDGEKAFSDLRNVAAYYIRDEYLQTEPAGD